MDKKKVIIISVIVFAILAVVGIFAFKTIKDKSESKNDPNDISNIIATDVNGTALVDTLNNKRIKAETEANEDANTSPNSNTSPDADMIINSESTSNASDTESSSTSDINSNSSYGTLDNGTNQSSNNSDSNSSGNNESNSSSNEETNISSNNKTNQPSNNETNQSNNDSLNNNQPSGDDTYTPPENYRIEDDPDWIQADDLPENTQKDTKNQWRTQEEIDAEIEELIRHMKEVGIEGNNWE